MGRDPFMASQLFLYYRYGLEIRANESWDGAPPGKNEKGR